MNKFAAVLGALALAGLGASTAEAQLATGTIRFLHPDGVVGANEIIPITVRLTLASDSTTLTVDAGGLITSGAALTDHQLRDAGFDLGSDFDPVRIGDYEASIGGRAECSGSSLCASGNYSLEFRDTTLPEFSDFSIMAGESRDFTYAEFRPKAGGAAPGIYNFYNYTFSLNVRNFEAGTRNLRGEHPFDIAETCFTGDDRCDFSRTVLRGGPGPIPEPSTWALMIGGFGLAGAALRRRRAVVSA